MTPAHLQGPSNTVFVLKEGELDCGALLAFTGGQCHGLALALHERTGWPLVAVDEPTGACAHVCVRRPDGLLVDVTGAHTVDEMEAARGGTLRDIEHSAIGELETKHSWAPAAVDPARSWVDPVLRRATHDAPLKPMSSDEFRRTVVFDAGLEVAIRWGGSRSLAVCLRDTSDGTVGAGTSYGPASLPSPQTGPFLIDFTPENFERVTDEWLRTRFDERRAHQMLGRLKHPL